MTADSPLPGTIPSPNVWSWPLVYEVENLGVDRAGVLESELRRVADWAGRDVVDLGCGTGFHLPRFAAEARSVVGIEPHPPLGVRARARVAGMPRVRVLESTAAATGLADASVDVAHARWAYFFGPGCEPGLAELERIVRPGGTAVVIDNDASRSTFGGWFRRGLPSYDPVAVERFWHRQGWTRVPLDIAWTFDTRADFEAVVGIEFAPAVASEILASDPTRTGVDYAVNLWWRRY